MRGKHIWKYLISFVMVCLLVVTAMYVPQAYSRLWDEKYLGTVNLFNRDANRITGSYNTSIENKLRILVQSGSKDETIHPIRQSKENVVSQQKLVQGLLGELGKLENLMWVAEKFDLEHNFLYADLYSVKDTAGSGEKSDGDVLFWYMKFGDYKTFESIFCVDAYTYTIYNASISTPVSISDIQKSWEERIKTSGLGLGDAPISLPEDISAYLEEYQNYLHMENIEYRESMEPFYLAARAKVNGTTVPISSAWLPGKQNSGMVVISIGVTPVRNWALGMESEETGESRDAEADGGSLEESGNEAYQIK